MENIRAEFSHTGRKLDRKTKDDAGLQNRDEDKNRQGTVTGPEVLTDRSSALCK